MFDLSRCWSFPWQLVFSVLKNMGKEQCKTGLAGAVIASETEGSAIRMFRETAQDAIEGFFDLLGRHVTSQRQRIGKILLKMNRPLVAVVKHGVFGQSKWAF